MGMEVGDEKHHEALKFEDLQNAEGAKHIGRFEKRQYFGYFTTASGPQNFSPRDMLSLTIRYETSTSKKVDVNFNQRPF